MAIRKSMVKVFNATQPTITPTNKKCKFCKLQYVGNEKKFTKRNYSRCIECGKKESRLKREKIKKRNIWNL
tara:strand:- start:92 stop:304 length:213 start_codon:yes stop_codon:yes gene_type:complete